MDDDTVRKYMILGVFIAWIAFFIGAISSRNISTIGGVLMAGLVVGYAIYSTSPHKGRRVNRLKSNNGSTGRELTREEQYAIHNEYQKRMKKIRR